ncbi:MAG: hypothetical protein IPP29_13255 [Bacteroidetes bacterium]|nr:hypothetical protein [Bacteroidota bacterium]
MLITADNLNATDALQWGPANHVVPAAELMNKCKEIAEKIKSKHLMS